MTGSSDPGRGNPAAEPRHVQVPLTTLPMNTLTPYLRAHLEVVDGTLRWDAPRTILGIVSFATRRVAVPLSTIRSTRARVSIHVDRLLVGLGLLVAALVWPTPWVLAPALMAGGVLLLMVPAAQLEVVTADRRHRLAICIRHKIDVDLIAAALDDLTGRGRRVRPTSTR